MCERLGFAGLVFLLLSAPAACREEAAASSWPEISKGTVKTGLGFSVGVAHDWWDGVRDTGFTSVGVRIGRFFGALGPGRLRGRFASEVELQPVFLMFQETSTAAMATTLLGSHYFEVTSPVRPFISFGAGVVYSAGDIPADASRWNFTPQIGFGVAFADAGGTVYAFEYRLYHMSNWSLVDNNPGINSSFFQFSWSYFKGAAR